MTSFDEFMRGCMSLPDSDLKSIFETIFEDIGKVNINFGDKRVKEFACLTLWELTTGMEEFRTGIAQGNLSAAMSAMAALARR